MATSAPQRTRGAAAGRSFTRVLLLLAMGGLFYFTFIDTSDQGGIGEYLDGVVTDPPSGVMTGQLLPDLALTTLDGSTIRTDDLRGRAALLSFWAPWCAPCRRELSSLQTLQQQAGVDALAVLTVATGYDDVEELRRVRASYGVTLPCLLDANGGAAVNHFVGVLPTNILIDPYGVVRWRTGEQSWSGGNAAAAVRRAMRAPPPRFNAAQPPRGDAR